MNAVDMANILSLEQEYCGDDPHGMKALTVDLYCLADTYQRYREKGIKENIREDVSVMCNLSQG